MVFSSDNQVSSLSEKPSPTAIIYKEKEEMKFSDDRLLDAMTGIEAIPSDGGQAMEPDHDTIKMFVGQIPRQWNEPECRKLFEKYGPVYSLNILRDKSTQQSKGCCFVTYYHRKDAIHAQGALHNVETIEGMHHPIQMKPADTENRNERKLFIGQLSKKQNEEEVRSMFSRFGHIEDCSVLRDSDGRSRGCAFVTFATRNCAVNATKEMHHSQTMEGCTAPLVVKFADSQKSKDDKGKPPVAAVSPVLPTQATLLQQLGNPAGGGVNLQTLTALATLLQGGGGQQQNVLGLLGNVLSVLGKLTEKGGSVVGSQQQQQPTANASPQNGSSGNSAQPSQIAALLPQTQSIEALAQIQQMQLAHQQQIFALAQLGQSHQAGAQHSQDAHNQSGLTSYGYQGNHGVVTTAHQPIYQNANSEFLMLFGNNLNSVAVAARQKNISPVTILGQVDPLQQAIQQYAITTLNPAIPTQNATAGVGNGEVKGPEGSNLFIYHLPQDFADSDLMTTFSPFGNVLSAKVFIDKITNLSKCFGFVSYDNAVSAQNAIAAMNGFQIGSKRLKVQLKNERNVPYAKVN